MTGLDPVEEYEELLDIETLRKARAKDDGYRISLEDFLKQNP
ncbi:antitoxin PHD [Rothia sp. HMSC058E10]|nr:antitoxin PHD [Rothia sp. HMSC058E10]OFN17624.1 antitoxin PHD [Rothia sp. HMSC058E10]